jgi:hypothetical protein
MKKLVLFVSILVMSLGITSYDVPNNPEQEKFVHLMYCYTCNYQWLTDCVVEEPTNCPYCTSTVVFSTRTYDWCSGNTGDKLYFTYHCDGCGTDGSAYVCCDGLWDYLSAFSHVNCEGCGRNSQSSPALEKTDGPYFAGHCNPN